MLSYLWRSRLMLALLLTVIVACASPDATPTATSQRPPAAPTQAPDATVQQEVAPPSIGGCQIYPADNVWNARVDTLPVHPRSDAYVNSIGRDVELHPDFGSGTWDGGPIGIPFVVVPEDQPAVPIIYTEYGDESDPGPFPIPPDAPREHGSDHHVLVVQQGSCQLYELYHAQYNGDGSWSAGSGATFDLTANEPLRPDGWTSADAAGLPIIPGLVRYDEVASGAINHAIRFTVPRTQRAYVWPARHFASSDPDPDLPPMGQRFRLKASADITQFSPETQVILRALRDYGMIVADNGSAWYISGAPDERWDNDVIVNEMRAITGDDFEAVDSAPLMIHSDTWQVRTIPFENMDRYFYLPLAVVP